ncbi:MAG: methyltransferase domain-containing protein [Solirubrobacterales bacterium]
MSATDPLAALLAPSPPSAEKLKGCCAAAYSHPAVRWLLGGELHPGGEETTRRALGMIDLRPGQRLLDVASGAGTSALLAAREFGAWVVGVDYGEAAVREACEAASEAGLAGRVGFVYGDAEELPLADASFDAVLCECSLCTFPDKPRAVAEIRRVLRPGGRLALSDVIVEASLPAPLRGAAATVACVGEALSRSGYEELLAYAGLRVEAVESRQAETDRFARRIEERLRGARLLGAGELVAAPLGVEKGIEAVRSAREAIVAGTLGYMTFALARA